MGKKEQSDDMQAIAKRIKQRRIDKGYSYQKLADLTGLSKSTLQRYENGGISNLPLDKVELIASALGISAAFLMGWENQEIDNVDIVKFKVFSLFLENVGYNIGITDTDTVYITRISDGLPYAIEGDNIIETLYKNICNYSAFTIENLIAASKSNDFYKSEK